MSLRVLGVEKGGEIGGRSELVEKRSYKAIWVLFRTEMERTKRNSSRPELLRRNSVPFACSDYGRVIWRLRSGDE